MRANLRILRAIGVHIPGLPFNFLFSDDTGAIWGQMKPLQGMHAIVGVLSSARKIFLQLRLFSATVMGEAAASGPRVLIRNFSPSAVTVLTAKGYTVSYQECNGGHEYLCWLRAFADGLLYLAQ